QPALLLLDPSGKEALGVSGNAKVQVAGAAVVDSKSPSAVAVDGNGNISAGELDIVGGRSVSGHGKIVGAIHTGIAAQGDPLASLPAPKPPSTTFKADKYSGDLYPGTYERGIHVSDKASVTLHPGIYYVNGGLD